MSLKTLHINVFSVKMLHTLWPRLNLVSKPSTKSTQRLSNGRSPFTNYLRARSLDCHNMPSSVVDEENGKTLQAAATAHPEPKIYPNAGKPDYVHFNATLEEAALDEMQDERIEALVAEMKLEVFNLVEDGKISSSAYDTAWVARVPAIDGSAEPQFPQLVDWILENQLPDGSWGEERRFLACDRFLNTLACLVTLTFWGVGNNQLHRGLDFLRRNTEGMIKEAVAVGHHGFEMVFPALLNEAKYLGLDLPYDLSIIKEINEKRDFELKKASVEELHTQPTAMLQYLEGIQEVVDWKDILKLQSKDGSFSGSPASTACVFMHTGDKKCLQFLTDLVTKFEDHVPCMYPVDIAERLRAVDSVECLGLERHFQKEIKQALDYVFQYWGERGVGFGRESMVPDIDVTATGFRLLRMFGYTVSSDVLQNIKGEAEELCKLSDNENGAGAIDMLSLYRCSQVNFPGENVMREIGAFAKDYLAKSLQSNNLSQATAIKDNLRQEVEYALFARWNRNMPWLMTRNHIEVFNPNDLWLGKTLYQMPNASNEKYLEVAKLNFNRVQAIHRSEIQHIKRWYKACNFPQLEFTRHREVAIYWTAAAVMPEPQYTDCRLAYAKAGIMAVITDDLYDTYATLEQAKLFNEAFERWDPLQIDHLPKDMRIVFMGLYNTLIDISERTQELQGRDVLPYLRQKWLDLFLRYTTETEWMERRYSPSLDEYWENAVESIALAVTTLTPIFSTGDILPDHLLQKFDFRAEFLNLVSLTGRLINDVRTFQEERDRGELASCVQCYINDHPGCTEEAALNYLYGVNEDALTKLNYHFLMRADIPKSFRTLLFNTARVMQLFYRNIDGFLNAAEEMKEFIKKTLYEPLL
ncbi:bifunctional levopimaradiene synthase, chloroplastic isoform X2 [Cryptomeria japonica]|uniref:bifunctional levopimaradiene synthase, chloroplastic isoform X2 n=1 Tax=Cryptomeria japonica TaxID=3369 RepID=UPI0027DA3212|nr:bifunctional levopimaradiene synthase, chloroplastic isoform X2 [Cryptomeria japonica]